MEQIPSLAKKQSLPESVQRTASDYLRMFEVKCSYWSKQMSPQCLAMVCLDLAARSASVPLDKSRNHKLVGVTKSAYGSAHQVVEKTLDLHSCSAVKDYAVQFGCTEVQTLAEDILSQYKETRKKDVQSGSVNLDAAMYPLTAVYTACKHKKIRVDRTKFLSSAGVSLKLFQSILDVMLTCIPKPLPSKAHEVNKVETKDEQEKVKSARKKSEKPQSSQSSAAKRYKREDVMDKVLYSPLSEEFVKWKEETIAEARRSLALSPQS